MPVIGSLIQHQGFFILYEKSKLQYVLLIFCINKGNPHQFKFHLFGMVTKTVIASMKLNSGFLHQYAIKCQTFVNEVSQFTARQDDKYLNRRRSDFLLS